LQTITITGIKKGKTVASPQNINCPLAVYVNWEPLGCVVPRNSSSLEHQLVDIIRVASATSRYDKTRKPANQLLPAKSIRRTLKRYAVDAVAAAIEDGPSCFSTRANWKKISNVEDDLWWSTDSRPLNAVSRFSRQLRVQMNKPENEGIYVGNGREVLAVGVVFEYLRNNNGQSNSLNMCMLGASFAGENISWSFGNHQIGATNYTQLPKGDWSEVLNEAFLILLLGLAIVMFPKLPQHLQSMKIVVVPMKRVTLLFGFVVMAYILMIWEKSAVTRLVMDNSA
jgi:hypothetical protein